MEYAIRILVDHAEFLKEYIKENPEAKLTPIRKRQIRGIAEAVALLSAKPT